MNTEKAHECCSPLVIWTDFLTKEIFTFTWDFENERNYFWNNFIHFQLQDPLPKFHLYSKSRFSKCSSITCTKLENPDLISNLYVNALNCTDRISPNLYEHVLRHSSHEWRPSQSSPRSLNFCFQSMNVRQQKCTWAKAKNNVYIIN